jgi:hypothetical protein
MAYSVLQEPQYHVRCLLALFLARWQGLQYEKYML